MNYQVAIIGGGFYGCAIALHLRRRGYQRIVLIEQERQLLRRASYANQARVHNGYHYPRSYLTAYRSRVNLPRFCREYGFAVHTDFTMLYAVAAKRSKVVPRQFERFMRDIGAKYENVGSGHASLFERTEISAVYVVEEYAFDSNKLREFFSREMSDANIALKLGTECLGIDPGARDEHMRLIVKDEGGISNIRADAVLNCTYSALNRLVPGIHTRTPLKHEIAELALIEVPSALSRLGITVMDGPFFSCMPFPAEGCHSLSHVRYTPHACLLDESGTCDPVTELSRPMESRAGHMIADAARLVPSLRDARWHRSLFETKTVLLHQETSDGRPVFLRREAAYPRFFSILGAKIDNIYDVFPILDRALDDPNTEHADPGVRTALAQSQFSVSTRDTFPRM